LWRPWRIEAYGQPRIVAQPRPDADDDRIRFAAKTMRSPASGVPGDPAGGAVQVGDLAIEGHPPLERRARPSLAHRGEEHPILALGFPAAGADDALDTRGAELGEAAARDERIGIADRCDHAHDTSLNDRGGAGRCPSLMRARLERHIERGAARAGAGCPQGLDLGVGPAGAGVESFADDVTAGRDDHRADQRVRRGQPAAALGQLERPPHEALGCLALFHASATSASTNACASNGWRSSSFSPSPMSFTGTLSSRTMRMTIPPLAVPSSLVRQTPVRPIASWNIRAWANPFWPVGASRTIKVA